MDFKFVLFKALDSGVCCYLRDGCLMTLANPLNPGLCLSQVINEQNAAWAIRCDSIWLHNDSLLVFAQHIIYPHPSSQLVDQLIRDIMKATHSPPKPPQPPLPDVTMLTQVLSVQIRKASSELQKKIVVLCIPQRRSGIDFLYPKAPVALISVTVSHNHMPHPQLVVTSQWYHTQVISCWYHSYHTTVVSCLIHS